ncbi:MAG: RNA methyltransferase [Myxococcaceae bacterium]
MAEGREGRHVSPSRERLFATCTRGLEPALEAEAKALGFSTHAVSCGVELEGARGSHRQANLWLRTASSVARVEGKRRVDTSGELLYFRGYRQEIGRAPLRETLAAGMLLLARWEPSREALWDPMCGSGTILAEAALMAQGKAPGAQRRFAFENEPGHDSKAWATEPRTKGTAHKPLLLGTDLNAGALGTARRNARRAGVLELLTLERLDATKLPAKPGPGLVISNLPYGKRVGERSELASLYSAFGASLRKAAAGWRFAFLLKDHPDALGLKIDATHALDNGGLSCSLVTGVIG